MRWLASLLFLVLTAACTGDHQSAKYSGYYTSNFEVSLFRPKGSNERWWVVGNARIPCHIPSNSYVYVEVIGILSSRGMHGHEGMYDRQLEALKFVSCRPARNDELREL